MIYQDDLVFVGRNNEGILRDYLDYNNYNEVIIVSDVNLESLGLLNKLTSEISSTNHSIISGVQLKKEKGPYVYKKFDAVIGFGGGTNLDQAKLVSKHNNIPWISVPTKGTHAMMTPDASIEVDQQRAAVRCSTPTLLVADLNIITSTPLYLNLADFGDALSSITGIYDCIIASLDNFEVFHEEVAKSVFSSGQKIMQLTSLNNPTNIEELFFAELNTAQGIVQWGSSLPTSGLEHSISHALDYLGSDKLHGTQVGLAALITSPLYDSQPDLHEFLKKLGLPYISSTQIKEKSKALGLPLTAKEVGISEETLLKAFCLAEQVRQKPRYTVLNRFKNLDKENHLKKLEII